MQKTIALTAATLALAAGQASAQISFQPAQSTAASANPDASVLFDRDGDGDLDLAVSTDAPDKLTLFTNTGGSFGGATQVFLGGGTGPHTPAAGDWDGDGDMDLAVSLHNANSVQLVINNGGSFAPGATFAVGADPRDLATADLDGDGDPDLAVSCRGGNTVSVLRNMGGLSFQVASYGAGNGPRELALGDFTGDGLPDLAVSSHDDRTVTVLRNSGAAAMVPHAVVSLGALRPEGLDAGDVDGNGTIDLVAAASNNGVEFASVLLNAGGGSFGGAANFMTGGQDGSSLVLRDFDVDGALDVAVANTDSNNVSTLRNLGGGSFGAASQWAVGSEPGHVTAGDVDGNGSADLVTANDLGSSVSLLINANAGSGCATSSYCTAKVNSAGQSAAISSFGVPSAAGGGFSIQMTNSIPGNVTIAFYGTSGPASTPFMNAFLCVQPPTTRLAPQVITAGGGASYPIAVSPAMSGSTRWYQFWYRDPAHPDGTGASLSDGLAVTFCD